MVSTDYLTQYSTSCKEELTSSTKLSPETRWDSHPSTLKDWYTNSTKSSKLNIKRNSPPRVKHSLWDGRNSKRMPRRQRNNRLLKVNRNPRRSQRLQKLKLNRRSRNLKYSPLKRQKSSGPTLMRRHVKRDPLDMTLMNQSALTMERLIRNITGLRVSRALMYKSSYPKAR